VTLEDLLVNQWGIDAGYVAGRITTLFVNSRAVDAISTTLVPAGRWWPSPARMPGWWGNHAAGGLLCRHARA